MEAQIQDLVEFARTKADTFLEESHKTKTLSLYTIPAVTAVILLMISLVMTLLLKGVFEIHRKERKQQKAFILQSRMAQMGELISMIAHQWKQPISAIAAATIGLKVRLDLGKFDPAHYEELMKYTNNVEGYINDLSVTLDDFRNFYKPHRKAILVPVDHPIIKALNIIRPSLLADGIEVIEDYNTQTELYLFENECTQVILNLLKNSQDNFREKNIQDPKITITTENHAEKVILEICDNADGIPDTIIKKIFDPYFSTKNEKNGAGLGLYMSKIIIESHHKRKLYTRNQDNGACFTIELDPKKLQSKSLSYLIKFGVNIYNLQCQRGQFEKNLYRQAEDLYRQRKGLCP